MGIVLSMLVAVTSVMPAQLPPDAATITQPIPVLSNVDAVRHIQFDLDITTFTRQRSSYAVNIPLSIGQMMAARRQSWEAKADRSTFDRRVIDMTLVIETLKILVFLILRLEH